MNHCVICNDEIPCSESAHLVCGKCACQIPIEENILTELTQLRAVAEAARELYQYYIETGAFVSILSKHEYQKRFKCLRRALEDAGYGPEGEG